MNFKTRTPDEIWEHHGATLAARDISNFILDFADDCIFINNPNGGHASGTFHGPEGVAEWCKQFFKLFDKIEDFVLAKTFFQGNIVVVEWEIESTDYHVTGGVDTFIIKDGQFCIVTVVYNVIDKRG